jgi:2,3-dihydroxybenzoate-AMP ligase
VLAGCVPWPEELTDRYRREGYWTGETLADLLRPWARWQPERTAVVTPEGRWSYGDLDARCNRLAAALRGLGIAPLDRIVVQLPNTIDFVVVCVALFRLGALPVLALPPHRRLEIAYLCAHTEAVAYVVPAAHGGFDYLGLAREVKAAAPSLRHVIVAGDPGELLALDDLDADPEPLPAPPPAEVAFFLLSGGTTGVPKLIPRTHDDYAFQLRATAEAMRHDATGVYLAALPAAHNAALGCPGVLGTLRAGGKVVLAPSPAPDEIYELVGREGVTLTTVMPSVLALWLETAEFYEADLAGVTVEVGGAMLSPEVARRVGPVLGCTLTHWFGMAEGLLCFTRPDDSPELAATTQGYPLCPADELRVVDELDRDVAPGAVGQLLVRGPTTLRGYYRAEELNASAFTADGYFRTGDLVRWTPERRLVAEGRVKDIVNRGGEKVPATELEEHLRLHPAVRNAAVVPMPDRLLGEKTCAFLVVSNGVPELAELRDFLRAQGFADYKLPDRVEVVDTLPLTSVGKVDKRSLQDLVSRRQDSS